MKKNKSLRDQLIVSFQDFSKGFTDCKPRALFDANVYSLRNQIRVERVDMHKNDAYRPVNNLSESRVLGALLVK